MTQTVRPAAPLPARRSRWPWLAWAAAVLLIVVWWTLYQSRWFLIEDVKVTGVKRLTVQAVLSQAHVELGQPLMSADPHKVHDLIVALPAVRQVVVERGWPHTLLIHVSERQPVAVVPAKGAYIWVDEEGHVAGSSKVRPPHKVVIRAKPETEAIRAALNVYAGIPSRWGVLGVAAKTQDSVMVQLHRNRWVLFGSAENLELKIKVADALLLKGHKVINVTAPYNPTVKQSLG